MMPAAPVLLIGSVPLDGSEAVFRILGEHLGGTASRYPDGETGDRINWVRWQRHVFDDNPDLMLVDPSKTLSGFQDNLARPFYGLREGVDATKLRFNIMGYGKRAIESFAVFKRLKDTGAVPTDIKFQVCLPTVVSLLTVFVLLDDRELVEPALEIAIKREVEEITANIPAHELAIQWDFCHEVIGHDGGIDLHFDNILENATARLCRLVESVHADVEVGVHLCYGDPGHKHVIEPKDAATCVAFGNKISEMSRRAITWLHFPIPRGWVDRKFYEPLSKLHVGRDTKIYLGLVHHSDGIEGTVRRIMLARPLLPDFGVATECGFGRRDPATIPQLLQIHRAAAETLS